MGPNTIKGTMTQLQCVMDFIERNILVSEPVVADSKYDYIIDFYGKLYKIQCKSATLSEDGSYISLKTKTTNVRTMKDTYYTKDDIDYFYSCYDEKSYLIPVEVSGHGETRLRFKCACNNPNIRWASDYELDIVLNSLKEEVSS